ncbi:MAG: FHA domain-containing protein [Akkermansia sp.]|nr:FHA domain-containing protein [Akkermansia sp.]
MEKQELTIGREAPANLIIREGTISRMHAVLRKTPTQGVYLLSDLNSANGTYVRENGSWVEADNKVVTLHSQIMLGTHSYIVAELIQRYNSTAPRPIRKENGEIEISTF